MVGCRASGRGWGWYGGSRSRGQGDKSLAQCPEVVELHATQQALNQQTPPLLHAQEAGLRGRGKAGELLAPVRWILLATSEAPLDQAIDEAGHGSQADVQRLRQLPHGLSLSRRPENEQRLHLTDRHVELHHLVRQSRALLAHESGHRRLDLADQSVRYFGHCTLFQLP